MTDLLITRRGRALIAIACVAFALRLAIVLLARPLEVSDAGDYRDLAAHLVYSGEYYRIGNGGWDDGTMFQAYRTPGYPLARAALFVLVGPGPGPALWLNLVGEMAALLFLIATARRVLGDRGAIYAALLFTPIILFTASLMTESVSMGLWSGLAWAYVRGFGARNVPRALCLGIAVGAAILVRPLAVLWIPVLAAMLLARPRDPRTLAAFAAGPVTLVGAWALRNYAIFHTLVWSSTNLGAHNAADFGIAPERLVELRHSGLNEALADRALSAEVLGAATAAPVQTLQVLAQRLVDLFSVSWENCWELGDARANAFAGVPGGVLWIDWAVILLRIIHVLALLGVAAAIWRPQRRERPLLVPLLAFIGLQCLLSRGDVRFIAPVLPMLCIFAAGVLRRA